MQPLYRMAPLFMLVGVTVFGCGRDPVPRPLTPPEPASGTKVTLQVDDMVGRGAGVARAKKALASLPWVDQKSVAVDDFPNKIISFAVPDMSKFDRDQVLEAFQKHKLPSTKILSPAP